jgi:hypothetical protein
MSKPETNSQAGRIYACLVPFLLALLCLVFCLGMKMSSPSVICPQCGAKWEQDRGSWIVVDAAGQTVYAICPDCAE